MIDTWPEGVTLADHWEFNIWAHKINKTNAPPGTEGAPDLLLHFTG